MMAAYVVVHVNIQDPSWLAEYGPKAEALIQKHGGRYLVGGGAAMEVLEGNNPLPSAIILLEFPSTEQAKAWYNDPEYAPMITLRQSGSDANIVVVEATG